MTCAFSTNRCRGLDATVSSAFYHSRAAHSRRGDRLYTTEHTKSISWASHGDHRRNSRTVKDGIQHSQSAPTAPCSAAQARIPSPVTHGLRDVRILQGRARKSQVAGPTPLSLAAASKIEQPACPSAHRCCGGVWARRVDGPALTHGGLRPLVTLQLTADEASVGAVSKTQLGKGRVGSLASHRFVAHINCVGILRSREWSAFFNPFISSTSSPYFWFYPFPTTIFAPRLSFIVVVDRLISFIARSITRLPSQHTASTTHSK